MQDREPEGFLAAPRTGAGPGVLVLHAWWGLNDTIKDFCTRLAAEGFLAFAPDLYHGRVAARIEGAERLRDALDFRRARAEVVAAVDLLAGQAAQPGRHRFFSRGLFRSGSLGHRPRAHSPGGDFLRHRPRRLCSVAGLLSRPLCRGGPLRA